MLLLLLSSQLTQQSMTEMQQLQQNMVQMQTQIDSLKHVQDQYEVSATVFINKSAELQSKLRAEGLGGTWTEVQLVDLTTSNTSLSCTRKYRNTKTQTHGGQN